MKPWDKFTLLFWIFLAAWIVGSYLSPYYLRSSGYGWEKVFDMTSSKLVISQILIIVGTIGCTAVLAYYGHQLSPPGSATPIVALLGLLTPATAIVGYLLITSRHRKDFWSDPPK